jgi:transposase
MDHNFAFSEFLRRFPDTDACLEEIKKIRYPQGITCAKCKTKTRHYRIKKRLAYACYLCRHQVYPLKDTVFEKSATPLRLWFYCLFLMTQTRSDIPITTLQKELGVTYKTAWRMCTVIKSLMAQNNGDLLFGDKESSVRKWVFFNKIEFTVSQTKESVGQDEL